MRTAGFLISIALACGSGCKPKSEAEAAPDPALLKAQNEMMARRDELVAKRKQLEGERDKIDEQIKKVKETGGDTNELDKQRAAIDNQIETGANEATQLSSKLDQFTGQVAAQGGIASREAGVSTRETNLSTREKNVNALAKDIADREAKLAQREHELAIREKETCQGGGMVIQQVAAPKGDNYTKKDIEPLLGRARATIQKKGLLPSDLGPAANLENESTKAMAENNWGKAYLAAAQLAATVDAVKIDRNFINVKYNRLNQRVMGSGKLDEATRQQLTDGMKDVLQKYGDGDFASANAKLNSLWSLMK